MANEIKIPTDPQSKEKIIRLLQSIGTLARMAQSEVSNEEVHAFSDSLDMIDGDLDTIRAIIEGRTKVKL